MPNPLFTYTISIYELVWLGFTAFQDLLVIQCQVLFIPIYMYIYTYDL